MNGPALSLPEPAPLLADVAEGPEHGTAWWLRASDGTRLRMVIWQPRGPARGTILLFPGRTEYAEKYGRLAVEFTAAGWAVAAMDWRGQGLSDRPGSRHDLGHVEDFEDYRRDVCAMRGALDNLSAPKPWVLLAHSMGGAIGLRTLHVGLPVERAAFSAPMWGIEMSLSGRVFSALLSRVSGPLGLDQRFTPSTGPAAPLPFEGNRLTSDRDQFDYMERQTERHPELALGGPSVRWLIAALQETASLMALPPPDIPALTFLGTDERIVAKRPIERHMSRWAGGRLEILEGARHEVLMEAPPHRERVIARILDFFAAA